MTLLSGPSDRTEPTFRAAVPTIIRIVAAVAVLIGGLVHLQLYFSGYRNIPDIGRSFALKGFASVVVAGALVVRRDAVVRLAAAALAASTLLALALSRTDRGVFDFQERGLEPSPQTAITLLAEIVVIVAVAITFLPNAGPGESLRPRLAAAALLVVAIVSIGPTATWAGSNGPSTTESAPPTTEPAATSPQSADTAPDTAVDGPETTATTTPQSADTAPDTAVDGPETAATTTLQSPDTTDRPASTVSADTVDRPDTSAAPPPPTSAAERDPTPTEPARVEPDTTETDDTATVVSIVNFAFDEQDLEIPVGTTVRWVNDDSFAHSVVADDDSFVSERLETGDEFEFTFTTAGRFDYICGLHPSMRATITVVG